MSEALTGAPAAALAPPLVRPVINVWEIEATEAYQSFLRGVRGVTSYAGRSLVLARTGRSGMTIAVGVRMSTGDEFWMEREGDFEALLNSIVERGSIFLGSKSGHPSGFAMTRTVFPAWDRKYRHQGPYTLEFCSSNVGGFTRVVSAGGQSTMIDED